MSFQEKEKKMRSESNKRLIFNLLFNPNATFSTVTMQQSNFPPRPTIKKDPKALEFMFKPKLELIPCEGSLEE